MVLPLTDDILFGELTALIKDKRTTFHFPLEDFVGDLDHIFEWKNNFSMMKRFSKISFDKKLLFAEKGVI